LPGLVDQNHLDPEQLGHLGLDDTCGGVRGTTGRKRDNKLYFAVRIRPFLSATNGGRGENQQDEV
jgi:hypothetical protein